MGISFTPRLRETREARGLSQQLLAARVGLSRQALSAVEAGRSVPGTDVALSLARALQTTVEALFARELPVEHVKARLVRGPHAPRGGGRVLLADIDGELVARALDERSGVMAADGVVHHVKGARADVELLGPVRAERLVVMGCAPTLGLLSARLARGAPRVDLAWVHGTSHQALEALARKEVHVAGLHLRDHRSGNFNAPQVQRRFGEREMLIVNFATWEQGLVVARGNPLSLKRVTDLVRPRIRLVAREAGSGAMQLLEQELVGAKALRPVVTVRGHLEVAQAIAQGVADVGVAIRAAALAWGLDFVPLCSERFDLVFPRSLVGHAQVERLVDELGSASFRRELDAVGGYDVTDTGTVVSASGAT